MQPRMGGIIQANIPDVETLFASYMPYVVGGGLMVAAIVLLVTKKRMENK